METEDENWLDKLDYALEEKSRANLGEVIDELAEEGILYIDDINDKNNLYHLFKSSKQTGLCDRLKKYLNFDIDAFSDENKNEKLCFIKYIFLIEQDFPLIKIFSNPTLAEINVHNQLKQRNYDENLYNIALKIRSKISDNYADTIDRGFYEIAEDWMGLCSEIFNMISDAYFQENQRKGSIRRAKRNELLNNVSKNNKNLDIIQTVLTNIKNNTKCSQKENHTSLKDEVKKLVSDLYAEEETANQSTVQTQSGSDKIYNIVQYLYDSFSAFKNKIETDKIINIKYRNGIFETFYNLFNKYYVMRLFSDAKMGIDFNHIKESADVQKFFFNYADRAVKYETLEKMQKILSGRSRKGSFEELFTIEKTICIIREGVTVDINDADIRFALKHLRTVMDWWMPDKHDKTYVNIIAAVTVMQELAWIYHTKEKFTCQYNKHDDEKTFSAIIAKPESADRLAKIVIVNRLNYRFVANIGGVYAIENIQKIKCLISELVEIIMLYNNFKDAQVASYFIHTHLTDVIKMISEPPNTKEKFESLIYSYLLKNTSKIKTEDSMYLKRILHEDEAVLQKLAKSIAKDIDAYSVDWLQFVSERNVTDRISVRFFGDTKKGYIKILQLYIICKEYERKKLKELCLENCIL